MRRITTLLITVLLMLGLAGGQTPAPEKAAGDGVAPDAETKDAPEEGSEEENGNGKMTAADVEAFLDGIVPFQLAIDDIAGATIIVVKDGKVLFGKGYGYADVENKKPVTVEGTLFRPGSISKLFAWTAAMQLVEQGKLDLNKDVNEYLDFKIPEAFGKPITLKDLLTHTPGFEEQIKNLFTSATEPMALGDFLKTHIPNRIYPPGTVPAYSNYGTTLTGYIVERVSGTPFNKYVEENIFKPLGMKNSTFDQPLPKRLEPMMSKGYVLGSGEPRDFEVINHAPAGSLTSSAEDMAKFMLAHLQEGRFGDAAILKPETAKLMHSRLFGLDEDVNAMAHGFYEESRNGLRIVGHGGDTVAFHSDLHIVPSEGLGFFVSYNSAGRGTTQGRGALWQSFLDRYYPFEPAKVDLPKTAKDDAAAVAGSYKVSRRPENSHFYMLALLGEATVSVVEDGTLEVSALNGANGKPKRWKAIGPMKFREVGGQDLIVFKPDADGRMQMLIPYPFMMFHRVGVWENFKIMAPVVGVSLGIMVIALLMWPIAWFVRRRFGRKLELTKTEGRLRLLVRLAFAVNVLFVALAVGLVVYALSNFALLDDAGVKWFLLVQAVGAVGVLGTLLVFYNAVHTWMNKNRGIWMKLQATVFALACLGFLWFVFAGNLLSFTSQY